MQAVDPQGVGVQDPPGHEYHQSQERRDKAGQLPLRRLLTSSDHLVHRSPTSKASRMRPTTVRAPLAAVTRVCAVDSAMS
ncbi:MAG: hypothetical protein Q605_AUC01010G0005 [Actinomyces urogenitalis DORA_12]|uniref:Uncharacterized protein n=1 Tax=Actinomyces urogenitalis DORA_12 TaxID=1403939 RepID=W1V7Y1_9ACTO|nr:MAG: hypothetical protein Q605_AUC01010G0005 [Actinomyces urogenitalis DORA_12]